MPDPVVGETTVTVAKGQKANVVYNQSKLISCKYTLSKGDLTYEPSFNFDKQAPAVAVTKKQGAKDTIKVCCGLERRCSADIAAAAYIPVPQPASEDRQTGAQCALGVPLGSQGAEDAYCMPCSGSLNGFVSAG